MAIENLVEIFALWSFYLEFISHKFDKKVLLKLK